MRLRFLLAAAAAALAFALPALALNGDAPDHAVLDADAPPAERVPKFLFIFDDPVSWPGTITWKYNPAGAPASFADTASTVARITAGLDKWAAVCGVSYSYQGTTATAPDTRVNNNPDLQNVVGWGALQGSTAGLTWSWYGTQGGVPRLIDGDIIISPTLVTSNGQLDRVSVHEWGHMLGLAHSNMDGAVMSGPPYSSYNSLNALTDDDIRGCRCLYGPKSGQSAGYLCSLPREVAFGLTPAGSTSPAQTFTLTNAGNAAITLNAMSFASGGFSAGGCAAGTVLGPGQGCVLSLSFTPAAAVDYSTTLSIPIAGESQPYRISLTGTGTTPTGPSPTLTPASATFASQVVGTTSAAKTLTLSNGGGGLLTVNALTLGGANAGDFNRAGTCAIGTPLGAGATCSITLTFTPTATGARSATLAVGTDAGSLPSVTLSGTGAAAPLPPTLAITPPTLAFADQVVATQSVVQSVTMSNTGGGTLTIASIAFSGAAANQFLRTGCNAGTSLGAGQSCTSSVRFAPTALGAKTASLDVTSNGGGGSVGVSGNAIAPAAAPAASLAPGSLDFGASNVGTPSGLLDATITNVGTAPLLVGAPALAGANAGDFAIVAACAVGTSLNPGESCGYTLQFTPTAAGARSASLRVAHNALGSPSTIALAGAGAVASVPLVVVEFYYAGLDHYFITIGGDEITALDTGIFPGWTRTGYTFKAYATAQPGFSPICRYFLPQPAGSHFYAATPAECAAVTQIIPNAVLESTAVMYLAIPNPSTGACPAATSPVYRVWNHRPDTNHRYTASRAVRDAMVAQGWIAEGSGPDIVTYCAPQ